jgi:hypothetical protein
MNENKENIVVQSFGGKSEERRVLEDIGICS